MNPADEFRRADIEIGFREKAVFEQVLHFDMGAALLLQCADGRVAGVVEMDGAFDVERVCIVAFDAVGVVAVYLVKASDEGITDLAREIGT